MFQPVFPPGWKSISKYSAVISFLCCKSWTEEEVITLPTMPKFWRLWQHCNHSSFVRNLNGQRAPIGPSKTLQVNEALQSDFHAISFPIMLKTLQVATSLGVVRRGRFFEAFRRHSVHVPWKRWKSKTCCFPIEFAVCMSQGIPRKFPGECLDHCNIYYIRSLNKGGGLRPSHLFRDFLCWGGEYSKYCSGQDSCQGSSLGLLGTCTQQIQLETNLFFTVSASGES